MQLPAPGACGSRSWHASARRGGSWGPRLRLWHARAPGAFGNQSWRARGTQLPRGLPAVVLTALVPSTRHAPGGRPRRRAGTVPSWRPCWPSPNPVLRVRVLSVAPSLRLWPSLRLTPLLGLGPPLVLVPSWGLPIAHGRLSLGRCVRAIPCTPLWFPVRAVLGVFSCNPLPPRARSAVYAALYRRQPGVLSVMNTDARSAGPPLTMLYTISLVEAKLVPSSRLKATPRKS